MHKICILTLVALTTFTSCVTEVTHSGIECAPQGQGFELTSRTVSANGTTNCEYTRVDDDVAKVSDWGKDVLFLGAMTAEVFYEGVLVEDLSEDWDGDGLTAMVDCDDTNCFNIMSLDDPDCVDLRVCDI